MPEVTNLGSPETHYLDPMISVPTLLNPFIIPLLQIISLIPELLLQILDIAFDHIQLLSELLLLVFGLFRLVFLLLLQLLLFSLLLDQVFLPHSKYFVVLHLVQGRDVGFFHAQFTHVSYFHLVIGFTVLHST